MIQLKIRDTSIKNRYKPVKDQINWFSERNSSK